MTYKGKKIERQGGRTFNGVPDAAKRLTKSVDNYKIVKKRGYPFGFKNKAEFDAFKTETKDLLKQYGIPEDKVKIHGSAVHKKVPGDVDVMVSVDGKKFDGLTEQFLKNSNQPKVAKKIMKEAAKGKIPSYRFATNPPPSKTIGQTLYDPNKIKKQVSLIKEGSEFDIGPYLEF
jgi:hypothetical protein